jgi:gas vesicle protein
MPSDPVYNPSLPHSGYSSMSGSSSSGLSSSSTRSVSSCASSSSSWGFVAGVCAGAAAGAAVALLYTPKRGSEIRSSLQSYAAQGGERLQELVATGRCLAEDALHQAAALIEEGRRAFNTSAALASSGSSSSSDSSGPTSLRGVTSNSSQPLTASVAEMSGVDRRFEEPLGG